MEWVDLIPVRLCDSSTIRTLKIKVWAPSSPQKLYLALSWDNPFCLDTLLWLCPHGSRSWGVLFELIPWCCFLFSRLVCHFTGVCQIEYEENKRVFLPFLLYWILEGFCDSRRCWGPIRLAAWTLWSFHKAPHPASSSSHDVERLNKLFLPNPLSQIGLGCFFFSFLFWHRNKNMVGCLRSSSWSWN